MSGYATLVQYLPKTEPVKTCKFTSQLLNYISTIKPILGSTVPVASLIALSR